MRRQRQLDRRQLARARRLRRRHRRAAAWGRLQPLALATSAAGTFTAACGSLGVWAGAIWGSGVGAGVGMFAGGLAATVSLIVIEWRISGE